MIELYSHPPMLAIGQTSASARGEKRLRGRAGGGANAQRRGYKHLSLFARVVSYQFSEKTYR
jgi:hypothetical protein